MNLARETFRKFYCRGTTSLKVSALILRSFASGTIYTMASQSLLNVNLRFVVGVGLASGAVALTTGKLVPYLEARRVRQSLDREKELARSEIEENNFKTHLEAKETTRPFRDFNQRRDLELTTVNNSHQVPRDASRVATQPNREMATKKTTCDHLHEMREHNAKTVITKLEHKGPTILDKENPSGRILAETPSQRPSAAPKQLKRIYDWSKNDSVSWFETESGIQKYQTEADKEKAVDRQT